MLKIFKIPLILSFILTACSSKQQQTLLQPQIEKPPHKQINDIEYLGHEGEGSKWAISSQGSATSKAAQEIFLKGGNIVDAAVAASFTIGVERPQSTGIGGGGFVMLYLSKEKRVIALDFRERAPLDATEKMYLNEKEEVKEGASVTGALASATPGMVAGVFELHKKYGKIPWQTCLQPAIRLAKQGVPVYRHLREAILANISVFQKYPSSAKIFLLPNGTAPDLGHLLIQKDLARTLQSIANKKASGFYSGWVAQALLKSHSLYGGILKQKDLNLYKPVFREPVFAEFEGYKIFSMPPPSSGGIHVAQILKFISSNAISLGKNIEQTESIDVIAKAMQYAFHDRSLYLGDPDFVTVPLKFLLSEDHVSEISNRIKTPGAIPSDEIGQAPVFKIPESPETTHFSIADAEGNILSSTQTINGWFGAGLVAEGAGFVLNNEMDDFSVKPGTPNKFGVVGGAANRIQGGKRPLSSMAPSIVLKDNSAILGLGTPSGSRIISCVTLSLINLLHFKLPLMEGLKAPRFHHQWVPDELVLEPGQFSDETKLKLAKLNYNLVERDLGCKIQLVKFESSTISPLRRIHGASDPRGEGSVAVDDKPL